MTEEFLQKYKELEQLVLSKFFVKEGESAIWALGSVPEFIALRPHLNAIREIRNFLAHQPKYEDQQLVTPTQAAVKIVETIIARLQGPNTVYSICYKISAILCAKMEDKVAPIVKFMQENRYHVVPIVEGGKIIGIITDSSKILKDIDDETTFSQIKESIDLSEHVGYTVLFIAKNATIEAAKLLISESFAQGYRIGAIFVTETGKQTEAMIGLLHPLQLV